jgi:hypothetical protein
MGFEDMNFFSCLIYYNQAIIKYSQFLIPIIFLPSSYSCKKSMNNPIMVCRNSVEVNRSLFRSPEFLALILSLFEHFAREQKEKSP